MIFEKTAHRARGQWSGILQELGIAKSHLQNKHGPCPMCGGKDRFRFDNKEGNGTWFCNGCGAGDGMQLAILFLREDFQAVAKRIDGIIGTVKADAPPPAKLSTEKRRALLRQLWMDSARIVPGDVVDRYLSSRRLDEAQYPNDLRTVLKAYDGDGGVRPAMIAVVRDAEGKAMTIHRTFLHPDGSRKALMPEPRKIMPGPWPDGSAVRLSQWTEGALGIAEGIETAMSAAVEFEMPVWAALNAGRLERWEPPAGCTEVAIFGDNDDSFTGHAAAYVLAKRLWLKGVRVTVHIPRNPGDDWCDVWTRRHCTPPRPAPTSIAAE